MPIAELKPPVARRGARANPGAGGAAGALLLFGGKLIEPSTGLTSPSAVLVKNGLIEAIGDEAERTSRRLEKNGEPLWRVDASNHYLSAGLVDLRARLGEPGAEHKETIASAVDSALAGGITTMVCLPDTTPPIDSPPPASFIRRQGSLEKGTKIYCLGCATKEGAGTHMSEMGLMKAAGVVGFGDGDRAIDDASMLCQVMRYAASLDMPVVQLPQETSLVANGVANACAAAQWMGLAVMPPQAEAMRLERDLRLVAMTGCRYHASLLSTADAVSVVRAAKKKGLSVTADTAPQYFLLTQSEIEGWRTHAKLYPPLRGESDRQAIEEGVIDGTIDAIVSDHCPQDEESKRVPFAQAAFGSIGLQTLLALSLELYHAGKLTLPTLISRVSTRPSQILGNRLSTSGRLEKGNPADLIVFDADSPWTIRGADLCSKSKNTVFNERATRGATLLALVDGRICFQHERLSIDSEVSTLALD